MDERYERWAAKSIRKIEGRCGHHPYDPETSKLVGEGIELRIREIYMQGGESAYREALALWQKGKALYPEYVSDGAYPEYVEKLWELPLADAEASAPNWPPK